MKLVSKCARGQIWYAEPDLASVKDHGYNPYYTKRRPYLIVSSDQGNFSSPSITALPITSNASNPRSVDVVFNLNGSISRISCSTLTQLSVDQLDSYIATLSPYFMEEVEKAIILSLGMSDRWVLRDKQVTELRDLISEYRKIQTLVSSMKQNVIDSYKDIAHEFISNVPSISNEICVKSAEPDQMSGDTEREEVQQIKKKRTKWDEESMRAFVDDYENNSKASMMEYYGYASQASLDNTYYSLRKKLASIDASNKEETDNDTQED